MPEDPTLNSLNIFLQTIGLSSALSRSSSQEYPTTFYGHLSDISNFWWHILSKPYIFKVLCLFISKSFMPLNAWHVHFHSTIKDYFKALVT